jgi:hypothetical protein
MYSDKEKRDHLKVFKFKWRLNGFRHINPGNTKVLNNINTQGWSYWPLYIVANISQTTAIFIGLSVEHFQREFVLGPVANIPGRASLRSAERHDLVAPRSKLISSSQRAFSVTAPRAWNGLPVDIRLITDTKRFKKKLQTFLFNSANHGFRKWNFMLSEQ